MSIKLPNKALSNIELELAIKELKIPNFKRVFLKMAYLIYLKKKECGILNLDNLMGNGTHWVAWYKNKKINIISIVLDYILL